MTHRGQKFGFEPSALHGRIAGLRQGRLAGSQFLEYLIGSNHVADAVGQQHGVQGLHDKIRRAGIIGFRDGFKIIQTGHDENGGMLPAW